MFIKILILTTIFATTNLYPAETPKQQFMDDSQIKYEIQKRFHETSFNGMTPTTVNTALAVHKICDETACSFKGIACLTATTCFCSPTAATTIGTGLIFAKATAALQAEKARFVMEKVRCEIEANVYREELDKARLNKQKRE